MKLGGGLPLKESFHALDFCGVYLKPSSAETIYSKYITCFFPIVRFSALKRSLALWKISQNRWRCRRCCAWSMEVIISRYDFVKRRTRKRWSIVHWNDCAVLRDPREDRVNSKSLKGVVTEAFGICSSAIRILYNSIFKSEKSFAWLLQYIIDGRITDLELYWLESLVVAPDASSFVGLRDIVLPSRSLAEWSPHNLQNQNSFKLLFVFGEAVKSPRVLGIRQARRMYVATKRKVKQLDCRAVCLSKVDELMHDAMVVKP